jgi:cytosine/adenosine deaminase-related metal-dependent hydrolase
MREQRFPRIAGTFGLHASLTLNDESLRACADAAPADTGFHIHVAEHEADEIDSQRRSGQRVVSRLDAYGIWRKNSIAAHCIHIDETEREILKARGVWITHQPRSNMNNAVGAMAFDEMMADGMRVCIGNDGFSNNMWADWKDAYLLHKVAHRDPRRANGAEIVRAATHNNACLVEQFFPNTRLGEIQAGAAADLILVDYHPFTPLTAGNLPWHILFGFEASMVTTTIVGGQVLMRDRCLLTLDETAIADEALALAPHVWERYAANVKAFD